jgi:phosphatidate cytidylyltransferase
MVLLSTLRAPLEGLPARLGLTMLGVLYVGLQATFMLLLRQGPNGYAHFCLYFAVIQAADAFAFFGGRAFGRHPIAPTLSPGKTWEGCAVGLLAALATAKLFDFAAPGLAGWEVLAISAAIFAFSLLGDLVASGFKRAAGLKDFGRLLPEQGGLLDRFDGYLFQLFGQ